MSGLPSGADVPRHRSRCRLGGRLPGASATASRYPIEGTGWYGIFAPAKTPEPVVTRLSEAIVAASRAPEVIARMQVLGVRPTGTTAAELARIQRAALDFWGPVIRASGFKPEQ